MDNETLKALKRSIKKWEKIVDGSGSDRGWTNCPLCDLFFHKECDGCAINAHTKSRGCENTPYEEWVDHQGCRHSRKYLYCYEGYKVRCRTCKKIATAEVSFLKSLLPKQNKQ